MILIGFEESQTITKALRARGIEAYSCDLQYPSGDKPEWHYKEDVETVIKELTWEAIILHPPCTYTALSGNRWYAETILREKAAQYTKRIWELANNKCNFVALEQPMTIMGRYIGQPTQKIQPWQFGHGETKETWLWLTGFKKLIPTNIVTGRESRIHQMGRSNARSSQRSKTYEGIAQAISKQWF